MEYRLATEKDLAELALLCWDFLAEGGRDFNGVSKREYLEFVDGFLRRGLESGNWAYWIAVEDDEIVSNVLVQKIEQVPRPWQLQRRFGYLTRSYTKPAWRNRGVGSDLMKRVKAWAKEEGLRFLLLWPSERSIPFWERNGFSREGQTMVSVLDE